MIPSISMWSLEAVINTKKWTQRDFIEWASAQNVSHVELLSYYMNRENNSSEIRSLLDRLDMEVSCYTILNDFSQTEDDGMDEFLSDLKTASELKATFIRVLTGDQPCSSKGSRKKLIERLKEASKAAEKHEITLLLENIGPSAGSSDEALSIIREVDSEYLRINFDTANPLLADESPLEALRRMLPFTSYVHLKDFITEKAENYSSFSQAEWRIQTSRSGLKMTGISPAEGEVELTALLNLLKEKNYEGFLSVEYENDLDPKTAVANSLSFIEDYTKTAPR